MEAKECNDQQRLKTQKNKIHAGAREVLQHGLGNFVWDSSGRRGEVGCSRKKLIAGDRRAEIGMRIFGARGPLKRTLVASSSAT